MSENTLQGGKQKCWLKCEKYLPNTNELIGEIGEDDAFFLGMRHRASKPPRAAKWLPFWQFRLVRQLQL